MTDTPAKDIEKLAWLRLNPSTDTKFLLDLLDKAIEHAEDLQFTFDLQWEADQRAIKRWQEAHPGNDLVWPDRADMVVWLMEQHSNTKDA